MAFPLLAVLPAVTTLLDRLLPDPKAKDEAKLKLLEMAQTGELAALTAETDLAKGQLSVNLAEAQHSSLFVAGWRPGLGWVMVAIMATNYIGIPALAWLSPIFDLPVPNRLDIGELYPVLLGMLGLGGLRTAEKMRGVA